MFEYDFKFISSSTLGEDWNMKSERSLSPRLSLSVNHSVLANLDLPPVFYKQLDSVPDQGSGLNQGCDVYTEY